MAKGVQGGEAYRVARRIGWRGVAWRCVAYRPRFGGVGFSGSPLKSAEGGRSIAAATEAEASSSKQSMAQQRPSWLTKPKPPPAVAPSVAAGAVLRQIGTCAAPASQPVVPHLAPTTRNVYDVFGGSEPVRIFAPEHILKYVQQHPKPAALTVVLT